jgi:hypothetical protein
MTLSRWGVTRYNLYLHLSASLLFAAMKKQKGYNLYLLTPVSEVRRRIEEPLADARGSDQSRDGNGAVA